MPVALSDDPAQCGRLGAQGRATRESGTGELASLGGYGSIVGAKADGRAVAEEILKIGYAREIEIIALFELLGMTAKAGGVVQPSQIREAERFMSSQIPASQRPLAINSFRSGKDIYPSKDAVIARAFSLYGLDGDRWLEPLQVLDMILRTSFSGGGFNDRQFFIVDYARTALGVHKRPYWVLRDTRAEQMGVHIRREGASFAQHEEINERAAGASKARSRHEVGATREKAIEILGISASATVVEVKTAYRTLVKRHHPDCMGGSNVSDEDMQRAVERFCEIQQAYELLMKSEGGS